MSKQQQKAVQAAAKTAAAVEALAPATDAVDPNATVLDNATGDVVEGAAPEGGDAAVATDDAAATAEAEGAANIEHVTDVPQNEKADTEVLLSYPGATSVSCFGKEWFVDDKTGTVLVPHDTAVHLQNEGIAVIVTDEE